MHMWRINRELQGGKAVSMEKGAMVTVVDKEDDQCKNRGQYTRGVLCSFRSWQFRAHDGSRLWHF